MPRRWRLLPLTTAETGLRVLVLAKRIPAAGNPAEASDATVAGVLAYGGLEAALYNVRIHLPAIQDPALSATLRARAGDLAAEAAEHVGALKREADARIP